MVSEALVGWLFLFRGPLRMFCECIGKKLECLMGSPDRQEIFKKTYFLFSTECLGCSVKAL